MVAWYLSSNEEQAVFLNKIVDYYRNNNLHENLRKPSRIFKSSEQQLKKGNFYKINKQQILYL